MKNRSSIRILICLILNIAYFILFITSINKYGDNTIGLVDQPYDILIGTSLFCTLSGSFFIYNVKAAIAIFYVLEILPPEYRKTSMLFKVLYHGVNFALVTAGLITLILTLILK